MPGPSCSLPPSHGRFHEEMLDCCHPLPKVREEGITLTQVRGVSAFAHGCPPKLRPALT